MFVKTGLLSHFFAQRMRMICLCTGVLTGTVNARVNAFDPGAGFIENKGQIVDQDYRPNPAVKFLFSSPGLNIQLRQTGFSYDTWTEPCDSVKAVQGPREISSGSCVRHFHRVDVELEHCNPQAQILPSEASETSYNFFTVGTSSAGVSAVHSFDEVLYKNIYPGIDLLFFASGSGVKYNFIVHPGGNVSDIRLCYSGADEVALREGKICVKVSAGTFSENIPESYWQNGTPVHVDYFAAGKNSFGFQVATHAAFATDLIIDPTPALQWGTYYGGSDIDQAAALALDAGGNSYITGVTRSTNSIATAGAWQTSLNVANDVFLAKVNSTGSALVWGTFYGGASGEESADLALDGSGNIYVTGLTQSTTNISTAGAWQTAYGGTEDAFIAKFNSTGTTLLWGTYFGNVSYDDGYAIAVDASNNVFLTGITENSAGIATAGAWQTAAGGGYDAYLAKFSAGGTLQWATYYGNAGFEQGNDLALDAAGNIYVTGYTTSTAGIATAGAWKTTFGGNEDVFAAKFNSSGSALLWGTYYGGTGAERGLAIALDGSNNVYVAGRTYSTSGIATAGAFQTAFAGGASDGFVAKLNSSGSSLVWGTYYGGSATDEAWGIDLDASSNVFITGITNSTSGIATAGAWQTSFAGGLYDVALAMFSANGSSLVWGSYYGGTGADYGKQIVVDASARVFLTGYTLSTASIATAGAWHTAKVGSYDSFVAQFNGSAVVLPIELLEFDGYAEQTQNVLYWSTATETNNDYFTLFRSTDGVIFSEIGRVDGAGTSSSVLHYSLNDVNPAEGVNYYRLKQTDFNGQSAFSPVIALEFHRAGSNSVTVYPNPTNGDLYFDLSSAREKMLRFIITDASGKILSDETCAVKEGNNHLRISFSAYDAGIYVLEIVDENGEIISVNRVTRY